MLLPLKQMRLEANNGIPKTKVSPGESLSQEELAARINASQGVTISQGQISRYEAAPETIPFDLAVAWCRACGFSLEEALRLSAGADETGVDPGLPYQELHRNLELLRQYVSAAPKIPPELPSLSMTPDDLNLKINQWETKPTLLIAGRFDSGKTRLANALLGSDNLPAQYTPTTSIVTFVRHVDDRPDFQKEDVWIMKKGFDPTRWNDNADDYCAKSRLIAGGYESLRKFGIKDSEGEQLGAKTALVYMNSPLLHACTLIDVPGFQDDFEDAEMATNTAGMADILLYTSPAKGFLDAADFLHLGQLIRSLPPVNSPNGSSRLCNFFLIATHSDPSISDAQLDMILDKGSRRLHKHLDGSVFASPTHKLSVDELRNQRMFSFWYESPDRRQPLEQGLLETLSTTMPSAIRKRIDEDIKDIKARTRSSLRKTINSYEAARSEIEAAKQNIDSLRQGVSLHHEEVERSKAELKSELEKMRVATNLFIRGDLANLLEPKAITAFITRNFEEKEKGEAKKDAVAKLLEDLQFRLGVFLEKESDKLKPLIEKYLSQYDVVVGSLKGPELGGFEAIPFDFQGAFAGGLAAAGTLGALGLWASTMGNLGGYILVAKLASVLSIVGLGVGSTSLVTFVAAIGGPVTLAIGIAAVLTLGSWNLFGEDWKSRLAKKISKTLRDKKLLERIEERGDAFWESTWKAFELGAEALETKFAEYLTRNTELLEGEDSQAKIEAAIAALEDLRDFFGGIPWRLPV